MSTSSKLGINWNQTEVLALLWFDCLPFQPLVPPLKHLTKDHFLQTSVCFHHSNSQCLTPCGHLLHSTPTEPHVTASVRTICRTHSHIHYRRWTRRSQSIMISQSVCMPYAPHDCDNHRQIDLLETSLVHPRG